jgi:hypothetical protein
MTIKHLGGIFGRNPTFNDVTIDGGIYFEDGQAGNYLDDYEEGTWTPSLGGNTTYTAQSGTYTKVGNKVTVVGKITVNTLGTGSTMVVSGLPFTSANTTEAGGVMSYFTGIASAKSCVNASVDKNNTTITFVSVAAAGGTSTDIVAVFANSTDCRFTVTYLV